METDQISGLVLLLLGAAIFAWQYHVLKDKEAGTGFAIVESAGLHRNRLRVDWTDKAGQEHLYEGALYLSHTGYENGDTVSIYYDKNNPDDCGVLSFGYRFGVAWVLVLAGLNASLSESLQELGRWWDLVFLMLTVSVFFAGKRIGKRWLERRFSG